MNTKSMNQIPDCPGDCPSCAKTEPASLEHVDARLRNLRAYFKPGLSMAVPGVYAWEWLVDKSAWYFSPCWSNVFKAPLSAPLDSYDWWGSIRADDLEALQRWCITLLEGRAENAEVAFRMQRLDGQWAWLYNKGHISRRNDGRTSLVSGVSIDVSPLRSDAKFQHGCAGVGDNSFHAMLENSPDMVVRLDRELFPLYMNPKVVEYMGREREQYSFDDALEDLKIEQDQLEYLKRNVERVFDEGATIREQRAFRSPRSGQIVCGEYSFWPEYDPEGRIRSAMTHFRDLTEQVATEHRAKLNDQCLADLYHFTQMTDESEEDVLNFVLASMLKFTKSSSGFVFLPEQDLSGRGKMVWSLDHFGRYDADMLSTDRLSPDMISLTTGEGGVRHYRYICNGNGVDPFYFSFSGKMPVYRCMFGPAMDGERIACLAGVCNKQGEYNDEDLQQLETFINGAWLILRRRRFVRELSRAKDAAQHASKVKDEFLANVSHELRTPLNGLLSMLQLLNEGGLGNAQKDYVDIALQSGKTLLRIISDILDFSRMESGKMQLDMGVFDIKHAVESTLSLFARDAGQKGVSLEIDMDRNIPDRLLGDDTRVRQVLFNLLGNALKFTEKGAIRISCSLLPARADGKYRVYLAVADTGIGIPLEKQPLIFAPFIQVDSSTTRKYGGTGLGLGIVKRLVSMMQGAVSVESEEGEGTTVHCSMVFAPASCLAVASELDEASSPECCQRTGQRMDDAQPGKEALTVLVADDDAVSRFAMRVFIEREGHRAFCVPDGEKALEAMSLYPFDCVFTDIQMPDMDGLELAGRVRKGKLPGPENEAELRGLLEEAFPDELWPQRGTGLAVPIVAVSAHAMAGDSERFLQQGVDYYLAKPVDMERLKTVLESILASRSRESALLAGVSRQQYPAGAGR